MGYITEDSEYNIITPSLLTKARPMSLLPDEQKLNLSFPMSKRWIARKNVLNAFWRIWSNNYKSTLMITRKWRNECPIKLQEGLYIMVKDPNLAKGDYKVGIIHALHPSPTDNLVRNVTVKIIKKNGQPSYIRRPIQRISIFESSLMETFGD